MSEIVRFGGAIKYCLSKGYKITTPGVRYVIKSHPEIFVKSKVGNYHPIIYLDELDTYINLYSVPTQEWMTVSEASSQYNLSKNIFYFALKKGKFDYELFGRGRGVLYLRRSDVSRFVEEYRGNYKNS